MADPKKEAARLGAEAMLEAGKDAARKLYEDLTLSDEEKKRREAARLAAEKRKRQKWIFFGVAAIVGLLVAMALIASYWPYILGLAVLGVLGFLGYRRVRRALGKGEGAAEDDRATGADEAEPSEKLEERAKTKKRVADGEDEPAAKVQPKVRVEPPAEDPAVVAARAAAKAAERDRQIEDELAELKRRAKG